MGAPAAVRGSGGLAGGCPAARPAGPGPALARPSASHGRTGGAASRSGRSWRRCARRCWPWPGPATRPYARVAERMAETVAPDGRVALLEGAGHAAHLQQPEGVRGLCFGLPRRLNRILSCEPPRARSVRYEDRERTQEAGLPVTPNAHHLHSAEPPPRIPQGSMIQSGTLRAIALALAMSGRLAASAAMTAAARRSRRTQARKALAPVSAEPGRRLHAGQRAAGAASASVRPSIHRCRPPLNGPPSAKAAAAARDPAPGAAQRAPGTTSAGSGRIHPAPSHPRPAPPPRRA